MSGIFGACDLSGTSNNQARREWLMAMGNRAAQMSVARATQPTVVTEHGDGVGFGICKHRFSDASAVPQIERHDHLWLSFVGRLDHRQELDQVLGFTAPASPSSHGAAGQGCGDAAVVMAAYRRFGMDCVDRLFGDWAFALWDARQRRLVLARDATGIGSLFWWTGGSELVFASSMPVLLEAGLVPRRPDARWIAGLLTCFVDSAHPSGTAFQDVHALPAGHVMVAEQGRTELKRWWRPESLQPLWRESLPDLQERFLAVYEESARAVLSRDAHKTVATLSGGLDSGSVVALAAPMLAQRGQRLTAYVHRPMFDAAADRPTRTTDEWDLAHATAQHVGNVDAVACRSQHHSPLQAMRQWLEMAKVPSHGAGNWFWLLDIAQRAAQGDASLLLVGQAGNCAVSYAGDGSLWPRVLRLQWSRAWADLCADGAGKVGALSTRLIKPALRPAWRGLKQAFTQRTEGPAWQAYSLIHPAFERDVGLPAAMRADGHDPSFSRVTAAKLALFRLTLLGGTGNGSAVWKELGRAHGFEVGDPTRDRRLIELCWRLPDELFWAQGQRRGLVRRAMRDLLPAQVLNSRRGGLQSADLRYRLQACGPELLAEVSRLARHPTVRQWIDPERFLRCARMVVDSQTPMFPENPEWPLHLLRTLAAADFVSRHS